MNDGHISSHIFPGLYILLNGKVILLTREKRCYNILGSGEAETK
jgi:hypothetical protein